MIILETERLQIRSLEPSDTESMCRVFGDEEVMRFGDGVKGRKWVQSWIKRQIDDYSKNSTAGVWALARAIDQMIIGYCGIMHFPDICGSPEYEIAYRLAREFWGCGYGTEAVIAVRDYGFNQLDHARFISIIDPDNIRSINVAIKAGMRHENSVMLDGYDHPDLVYAVARK